MAKRFDDKKTEKKKSAGKKRNKSIIFIEFVLVIVIIVSGIKIAIWIGENNKSKSILEETSKAITIDTNEETGEKTYNINFEELKSKNNEVVGWTKVEGTKIEYPVVKANNNEKYLNTSFDGSYNTAGWPFADYRNKFDGNDKNIIIYGHNRKDNSMFGTQKDTLTENWQNNYKDNPIIFITENENAKYKVFSVYTIEDEAYYITTDFKDDSFGDFVNTLKNRSQYNFGIDVNENDNILTLSTCYTNNHRTVLHAVKIKDETKE